MLRTIQVTVEYTYQVQGSGQAEQLKVWRKHLNQVGLPLPAVGLIRGTGQNELVSVVEVVE